MLSVVMLNVVMLSVVMLSVVMLSVVRLNVVAPVDSLQKGIFLRTQVLVKDYIQLVCVVCTQQELKVRQLVDSSFFILKLNWWF